MVATWNCIRAWAGQGGSLGNQSPRGKTGEALWGWLHVEGDRFLTIKEEFYRNVVRKIKMNPWFWIRTGCYQSKHRFTCIHTHICVCIYIAHTTDIIHIFKYSNIIYIHSNIQMYVCMYTHIMYIYTFKYSPALNTVLERCNPHSNRRTYYPDFGF